MVWNRRYIVYIRFEWNKFFYLYLKTREDACKVAKQMGEGGYNVYLVHGEMNPEKRLRTLQAFKL